MHALKDHPDLTYVMAMQESLVVAIADGFSRASGRLVACNVHVAPGLGNAMGSLYNAQFTGTPMILTAGQQEQGHGLMEPLLYGPLVRMAEPLVKWAVEGDAAGRFAAGSCAAPQKSRPRRRPGPGVHLAARRYPNSEAGIELGRSTRVDTRVKPSDEALQALTQRNPQAQRPVIIAGDEIVKSDALSAGGCAGSDTWGMPGLSAVGALWRAFPLREARVLWGALSRQQKQVREVLSPFDLMIGAAPIRLRMSVHSEVDPLPDGLPIVQIGLGRMGCLRRITAAEIALKADVKETLRALIPALKAAGGRRARGPCQAGHRRNLRRRTGPPGASCRRTDLQKQKTNRRSIRTG